MGKLMTEGPKSGVHPPSGDKATDGISTAQRLDFQRVSDQCGSPVVPPAVEEPR